MAQDSINIKDENDYNNLTNQVNEEVKKAISATQSNTEKIPWEDFRHDLGRDNIKPVIERDTKGELELNYKVESFNLDSYEHENKKVKGVDLEVHNAVLEKVSTQKPIQALVNREALNQALIENVRQGKVIEIRPDVEQQTTNVAQFEVANNQALEAKLNALPYDKALEIAEKNNALVENKTTENTLSVKGISFEKELTPDDTVQQNKLKL